ncbi:MAG TPA: hypothetical protein VGH90_00670 [Chthoniobacteraceae bacterium]
MDKTEIALDAHADVGIFKAQTVRVQGKPTVILFKEEAPEPMSIMPARFWLPKARPENGCLAGPQQAYIAQVSGEAIDFVFGQAIEEVRHRSEVDSHKWLSDFARSFDFDRVSVRDLQKYSFPTVARCE